MTALSLVPTTSAAEDRSARAKPIAVIGQVAVLAPAGTSPYYRLTWTNPDGTRGITSGGRTEQGAKHKAGLRDEELGRAAGAKAMTPLAAVVKDYLSCPVGRNAKTGKDRGGGQLKQMRFKLKRCLRGHGDVTAMAVDRKVLDRMRSQAGTRRTRREHATALRGLLRWGATQGYFSAEQAELLPTNVYDLVGEVSGTEAPPRRRRTRSVGQSEDYQAEGSVFAGTELFDWLQERDIDTVTIVGYMTNNCVLSSAAAAADPGLSAEVLSDATGAINIANDAGFVDAQSVHMTLMTLLHSNFASVSSTAKWTESVQAGMPLPKSDLVTSATTGTQRVRHV